MGWACGCSNQPTVDKEILGHPSSDIKNSKSFHFVLFVALSCHIRSAGSPSEKRGSIEEYQGSIYPTPHHCYSCIRAPILIILLLQNIPLQHLVAQNNNISFTHTSSIWAKLGLSIWCSTWPRVRGSTSKLAHWYGWQAGATYQWTRSQDWGFTWPGLLSGIVVGFQVPVSQERAMRSWVNVYELALVL